MGLLKNLTHLSLKDLNKGFKGVQAGLDRGARVEEKEALEKKVIVNTSVKPKYTLAGNIIAGVANSATGGLLGQKALERAEWFNAQKNTSSTNAMNALLTDVGLNPVDIGRIAYDASEPYFGKEITKVLQKQAESAAGKSIIDKLLDVGTKAGFVSVKNKAIEWLKVNWIFLLIPFGLIIYAMFFRNKGKTKSYGYQAKKRRF